MADVAVVHPDLRVRGGAEDVCMHVLEALQDEHDLTLLTYVRPDFDELNRYYDTSVDPPDVRIAGSLAPHFCRVAGGRLRRLQVALLGRYLRRRGADFDLVVSTRNEFAIDGASVLYVHNPQFTVADPGLDRTGAVSAWYNRACAAVAGVGLGRDTLADATVLTNSDWTGDAVERAYGVEAETVYPPVDVEAFPDRPWEEREPGVLTIGRVDASKRILRNVEVVDRLRERGHDLHLHVVGPVADGEYAERVQAAAADREFVSVEGPLGHDELVELIASHRYGLHGRPYEHFGIVLAELVAGGALPFAPDSGGQREILGGDPRLLYDSTEEAVEKMDRVLSDREVERAVRRDLAEARPGLDPERFRARVRAIVDRRLAPP